MTGLQKEQATSGQFPAGQDLLDVCAERSLQFPGSPGQGSGHARRWPTPRLGGGGARGARGSFLPGERGPALHLGRERGLLSRSL